MPAKYLGPGLKWRIEVDINHLDALRRVARLTLMELQQRKICYAETYRNIMRTGIADLHIIARFATLFNIPPGELIVWFPVPEGQPEKVALGKGRDKARKKYWDKRGKRRHYKHWKPEEIEMLLKLRATGLSYARIGKALQRSRDGCKLKYQEIRREQNQETTDQGQQREALD